MYGKHIHTNVFANELQWKPQSNQSVVMYCFGNHRKTHVSHGFAMEATVQPIIVLRIAKETLKQRRMILQDCMETIVKP